MKWTLEIIKARHDLYQDGDWKCIGYYDKVSGICVPMIHNKLKTKDIMNMEEFTVADDGIIFLDQETNKIGLLIR